MKDKEEAYFIYIATSILFSFVALYLFLYYPFNNIMAIIGAVLLVPNIFISIYDAKKSIKTLRIISISIIKVWIILTLLYYIPLTINVILSDALAGEAIPEIGIGLYVLSLLLLVVDIVLSYYFYKIVIPNGLLVFKHRKFILYLRPFSFDHSESKISYSIKQFSSDKKLPVLKISEPSRIIVDNEIDSYNPFSEYILPHNDWKKELSFYISRASYIISVLDTTSGVFWEIFEHEEEIDKFVYYINDKTTLESVLNDSKTIKYTRTHIYYCLKTISSFEDVDNMAFCIKGNICYFSNLWNILLLMENRRKVIEYQSFELPCHSINKKESAIKTIVYLINVRDVYRVIEQFVNKQFWLTITILILFLVSLIFMTFFWYPYNELYPKVNIWLKYDFHLYENICPQLYFYEFLIILGESAYRKLEGWDFIKNTNIKIIYGFRIIRIVFLLVPYSLFMILLFLSYIYCLIIGDMSISEIWGRFIMTFVLIKYHNELIGTAWGDRFNTKTDG